jgi:DNA-binding Lrp family transcriptional regulator
MKTDGIIDDELDRVDRLLINGLQDGIPVVSRPFAELASETGITETELVDRMQRLLKLGAISRFGPFIDADAMGGAFCLCAMSVPAGRFNEVAAEVNACPAVAHNYQRTHHFNMWFVLACEHRDDIETFARLIEERTGLSVHLFPKEQEFFIGFKVAV